MIAGEVAAAGLVMGGLMIFLAFSGGVDQINRHIPKAVVRGIQLGVGLKLAAKGLTWILALPVAGSDSILTAIAAGAVLLILLFRKKPAALLVFLSGFLLLYLGRPDAFESVGIAFPAFSLSLPGQSDWIGGLLRGALPQAPLTILNSVIAVCALSSDYFPGRGIAPRRMAASVGLMNLLCAPLGGIPMCHGAGGLAAQYRFGARTGGSVIMLGGLKVLAGLMFGGALLGILSAYPHAILGPMLIFAGIELAKAARDVLWNNGTLVAGVTAIFILGVDTGVGFLVGLGTALAMSAYKRAHQRLRRDYGTAAYYRPEESWKDNPADRVAAGVHHPGS
jgi:MFS superfamily sulfate permease-like transporter